jgi:hypothetical protein
VPPPPRGAKPPARGAAQVAPPASVPIATYKAGNSDVTEIRAPEALADEDEDEDSAEFDVDDDELIEDQPT